MFSEVKEFKKAGVEMSMLLLRNSGWELLQQEENLLAFDQFKKLTGEDVLNRNNSMEEIGSGSKFKLAMEDEFLKNREAFWLREMQLRKLLTSNLTASIRKVRQVYFLNTNHDGFRLDWSLYGGDRLARSPWPDCFLNTSSELLWLSPEIGEAICLKGYLGQATVWGDELAKRLLKWSQLAKTNYR